MGLTIDIASKHAALIKSMLLTSFYASSLPFSLVFQIGGLIFLYWAEKYNFLRNARIPDSRGHELTSEMIEYLEWITLIFSAGSVVFHYTLVKSSGDHSYINYGIIWATFAISVFQIFFPMDMINEKIWPLSDQATEQLTHNEAILNFTTDYDVANPITHFKALKTFRRAQRRRAREIARAKKGDPMSPKKELSKVNLEKEPKKEPSNINLDKVPKKEPSNVNLDTVPKKEPSNVNLDSGPKKEPSKTHIDSEKKPFQGDIEKGPANNNGKLEGNANLIIPIGETKKPEETIKPEDKIKVDNEINDDQNIIDPHEVDIVDKNDESEDSKSEEDDNDEEEDDMFMLNFALKSNTQKTAPPPLNKAGTQAQIKSEKTDKGDYFKGIGNFLHKKKSFPEADLKDESINEGVSFPRDKIFQMLFTNHNMETVKRS